MTTTTTRPRGWRRWACTAAAGAAMLLTIGCATPRPGDYAAETPTFDLRRFFDGATVAHGMFLDRGGKVVRRFVVTIDGRWQGREGTLDERFRFSDGEIQRRVWRLVDEGGGRWTGRADDVVGVAQGQSAGNVLNWHYTLALPVDGRVVEVQFDDWMVMIDERVMLNRAVVSKFGVRVGEVVLSFTKPTP